MMKPPGVRVGVSVCVEGGVFRRSGERTKQQRAYDVMS